jgi:hypothetical protein
VRAFGVRRAHGKTTRPSGPLSNPNGYAVSDPADFSGEALSYRVDVLVPPQGQSVMTGTDVVDLEGKWR